MGRSEKKAQSQGELRAEDAGRAGEGTRTTGCVVAGGTLRAKDAGRAGEGTRTTGRVVPLLPLLWSPSLLSLLPLALAFPPCFRYNI